MTAYAELVAASNFSFLRGASKPEELAVAADALGYKALAICDRNTVAGVVRAHKPAKQLGLNDLGRIRLRSTTPLVYDPYRRNRTTGSFILVDEATNATVGAGMLSPAG